MTGASIPITCIGAVNVCVCLMHEKDMLITLQVNSERMEREVDVVFWYKSLISEATVYHKHKSFLLSFFLFVFLDPFADTPKKFNQAQLTNIKKGIFHCVGCSGGGSCCLTDFNSPTDHEGMVFCFTAFKVPPHHYSCESFI